VVKYTKIENAMSVGGNSDDVYVIHTTGFSLIFFLLCHVFHCPATIVYQLIDDPHISWPICTERIWQEAAMIIIWIKWKPTWLI